MSALRNPDSVLYSWNQMKISYQALANMYPESLGTPYRREVVESIAKHFWELEKKLRERIGEWSSEARRMLS